MKIIKYENIESLFPNLNSILLESLQNESLEIKKLNIKCNKYNNFCKKFPDLKNAKFVIYSPYIEKKYHKYEIFIFINENGKEVCHLKGFEVELYNMIISSSELVVSEDYKFNH